MSKVATGAVLLSITLAAGTPTGVTAQELINHTFRCPPNVSGHTAFDSRISSDPVFTLGSNATINARFVRSFVAAQKVGCVYQRQGHGDLVYSYMVQRQIVGCQNVGTDKREFTCQLRP